MLFNDSDGLSSGLGSVINGLLVVGAAADQRAEPVGKVGEDLRLQCSTLAASMARRGECPLLTLKKLIHFRMEA
jgi:hypothetical protein